MECSVARGVAKTASQPDVSVSSSRTLKNTGGMAARFYAPVRSASASTEPVSVTSSTIVLIAIASCASSGAEASAL